MERDIIQQLKDRDEAGAAAFLTHYGPLLRYILGPILPDDQDREECLSEIALRVWDKIDTYDPDRGSFTAWLTALARNAALNKARQGKRAASLEDLPPDYPARDPTSEEALLRQVSDGGVCGLLAAPAGREPAGLRVLYHCGECGRLSHRLLGQLHPPGQLAPIPGDRGCFPQPLRGLLSRPNSPAV